MPWPNSRIWLPAALFAAAPFALMAAGQARDPFLIDTARAYLAPALDQPFGTDGLGRDLLARTLYAAGLSLKVVAQSVAVSLALALALGGAAGYTAGHLTDRVISWIISLVYTVPFILIVVAVLTVIEPSIQRAYLTIGCIGWAAPARLVRAAVIEVRGARYVLAYRAFGFSATEVFTTALLPRSLIPAVLSLAYFVPELIGIEVGLSFFGLGAPPPTPTLGRLIYDGLSEFQTAWWLSVAPAGVLLGMTTSVISCTHLMLRRRILPRLHA